MGHETVRATNPILFYGVIIGAVAILWMTVSGVLSVGLNIGFGLCVVWIMAALIDVAAIVRIVWLAKYTVQSKVIDILAIFEFWSLLSYLVAVPFLAYGWDNHQPASWTSALSNPVTLFLAAVTTGMVAALLGGLVMFGLSSFIFWMCICFLSQP